MSRAPRRKSVLEEAGPPLSPLPPQTVALEGVWKFALPLILVVYLLFAGLHAAWVPTGETGYQNAPDEAAHVVYVRQIAKGTLPTRENSAGDPKAYEWHQPPLYYLLAAPLLSFGEKGLRVLSILCGVASIWTIFRTARLLFPNEAQVAPLAAGIAALIPTHIAITSSVNNDALLEVCFGLALWQCVLALRSGFTLWRAGWLGVTLGAACLTKANGLLLLPILALALALLWRNGEKPAQVAKGAAWMALLMVTVCGWWYFRNLRLYGELLPMKAFGEAFAGTAQASDMAAKLGGMGNYWQLVSEWSFRSFWAVYGTPQGVRVGMPAFLPDQIYLLAGLITLTVFAGLVVLHLRSKRDFDQVQRYAMWLLFATVGIVGASFAAFLSKYFQTQGRYLYPAMSPIALLFALGWRAVFPEKYRGLASGMLLGVLALFSVLLIRQFAP